MPRLLLYSNSGVLSSSLLEKNSIDIAMFSNVTNCRSIITLQKKLRDVYFFCLQNCSVHRSAISRLCFAASRYLCSEEELIKAKFGKIRYSMCGKKNFFINSRSLFLKIEKSGGFYILRMRPNVFFCNLECKTFKHLIFSSPSLQPSRNVLQINNWRDVFVSKIIAKLKNNVAVIRDASSNSSTSRKISLQTFVSWEI